MPSRVISVLGNRRPAPVHASSCRQPPSVAKRTPLPSDECGAAAVEMALVTPILIMLLLGIIEFSALFYLQNTMTQIANDVVRRVAVGELTDSEARGVIAERLSGWHASFSGSVNRPTAHDVEVIISVPLADAAIINFGGFLGDGTLMSQALMRKE